MKQQLWFKIKEALVSVLPVTIIVVLLNFLSMWIFSKELFTTYEMVVFVISALFLIFGIGLFNLGADMAMQPMGEQVGSSLMKTNKVFVISLACFFMGLLITIAEPDLTVLAEQVSAVIDKWTLIIAIGVGVGIFLVISIIKIILKKDLSQLLLFFYLALFAFVGLLISNGKGSLLALCFDSGGVTTGPITVPFIMALGVGVAATVGGRNANENSFGLIALCSVGPIIAMLILCIASSGNLNMTVPDYSMSNDVINFTFDKIYHTSIEVLIALSLISVFFLIINFIYIKLPKRKMIQLSVGIIYTFIGLVIFLTAVSIGFMPIGYKLGSGLADFGAIPLIVMGFILGLVVVLAEPAVHVLTKQVEEITLGGVSKRAMLLALSIGVGVSLGLSMLRIVFNFSILYYIIPGYLVSLGLSFFVPKMYTAIAFDSGGVASGPLTSSFILPLAVGACVVLRGNDNNEVLELAYGIVTMVAMTPLITIQALGFKAVLTKKVTQIRRAKLIDDADDEQIINFL